MNYPDIQEELRSIANPQIADHSKRFFKTGPGGYGEEDKFLGIRVPNIRKTANRFKSLTLDETEKLLHSEYHEERLCALFILVNKARKGDDKLRQRVFELYLKNIDCVNNWDLVDASAEHIIGTWLADKNRDLLYELAESDNIWHRRIALLSTFHFIKNGNFEDILRLAVKVLNDDHDLIHKASGWMLREAGNRDREVLLEFLDRYSGKMPRTMLRYAVEKLPENQRQHYLTA